MSFQVTEQVIPDDSPDALERWARKFDAALKECDAGIDEAEQSLRLLRERRMRLASGREEVWAAVTTARSALKTAHETFGPRQDGSGASTAGQPGPQLKIVPPDPPPHAASPHTDPSEPERDAAPGPHPPPQEATPADDTGLPSDMQDDAPAEVIVRGARMKQILTVMAQRPDTNWGTGDVAELLGVSESDGAARRALRENLRNLARRGALERVTVEGDFHTYYRPLMNWRFA
ncbi:hypothetical protein I3F58_04010 [Streptomyces sp. MUM 203J]|uniref:hypothetical protein n=1 Tax=Streptomyces sp. MUM 203J TaxID=2791990 RepID=UPI001F04AEEA|nr:hypothetical protein [Streptomyces sp. MUM 203J]MCH0538736.1 hypothetical protein [Streptomyces sp. MUM 203J]